jgi:hypothetical protein
VKSNRVGVKLFSATDVESVLQNSGLGERWMSPRTNRCTSSVIGDLLGHGMFRLRSLPRNNTAMNPRLYIMPLRLPVMEGDMMVGPPVYGGDSMQDALPIRSVVEDVARS